MSKLEDVLKPGNIVKIRSTIMRHKEKWGIILNNGKVMYEKEIKDLVNRIEI